jgi:PilZ domain
MPPWPVDEAMMRDSAIEVSRRILPFERRSRIRYPLKLPVRYRTIDKGSLSGEGHAANISSSGARIISQHQLCVGEQLELRFPWPSLLEERIALQLITTGKVVRCEPSGFVVLFRTHQFRTVGARTGQSAPLAASATP